MEIFISWSGKSSHFFAMAFKEWLPSVIQSIEPFISSDDISKGSRWFNEIGDRLEKINFGIICLTPENVSEPWILFESGALSKSIGEAKVAPILLGMSISDLKGPLAQFNATLATKEEIRKLLNTINDQIVKKDGKGLEAAKLDKIFEVLWPELGGKIEEALKLIEKGQAKGETKVKRNSEDILEELLELTRSNSKQISDLPNIVNDIYKHNVRNIHRLRDDLLLSDRKTNSDKIDILYNRQKLLAQRSKLVSEIEHLRARYAESDKIIQDREHKSRSKTDKNVIIVPEKIIQERSILADELNSLKAQLHKTEFELGLIENLG